MRGLACQQWSLSPPSGPCEFARLTSGTTNPPKHFNHSTPTQSQVSLSHRPRPRSEECRHSSREGTPTGWASLREVLFALGPLGPEVGMGADGSPLERRVSEKATWDRNLARQGFRSESVFPLSSPLFSVASLWPLQVAESVLLGLRWGKGADPFSRTPRGGAKPLVQRCGAQCAVCSLVAS